MSAFNIATFNIRYDNPKDGVNAWPQRREWVRALLDYHEIDIVGIQEALAHQADFLSEGRFALVGAGRDDGKRAGEFAAVLYDRTRFKARNAGTFWLSETPDTPSRGWDADLNRVCSWAHLDDKASPGRDFFVFNTHFDHKGTVARERSAELILSRIKSIAGNKPFFLIGDFNSTPDTAPIRRLASSLRDARVVSETKPYGPAGTFHGFSAARSLDAPIDYIFTGSQTRILKYAALSENWNGRFPSDHLPVVVRAEVAPV